ncbi:MULTISPECIES: arginine N-succinyltransferase [Oxalobacteraceae]|uniref:Arginine N-succinyltransferase n=1 Tax=Rugamonas rivuli TaxID=2743358 RepID=A0A843SPX1_9BURK|nr:MULTISPECIES: arginine N-succinyltransferase [Oxalobacteraceae]ELX11226.1 arginine N-succinyltransferase beta subunit AstA [Janthinobacterium sp. HH01]MQA22897.1 arginine N-succinyltransferase [Rugamonas rivuli]OEZ62248.1 arginine N-succinyltransferase [Duganella sp. HH105]OEZ99752.1 arginine N-succinyltransferase [Duganella sp. HH101]
MLVVRAITANDLDALYVMATQVGSGMTTLKPDMKMMGDRLAIAVASFAETIPPEKRDYMFVMEDTSNGRIAGVCAIKGSVGLTEPFYNYRIGTLVHSSRELDVFTRMDTLYLSNDLTGSTELCSLFLAPDYRTGNNGKLLSKSRFLFIAQFPHLFTEKLIAEMRGYQEEGGRSPFYEGLGRHFFKMDFDHVDDLTAVGKKSFIAELMPRQPLYVAYLPEDAQEVIGKVHTSTAPARRLLEQEGLYFEGYVDIFDAGPVLQARVSELRAMRESTLAEIGLATDWDSACAPETAVAEPMLVSNTTLKDFRMILSQSVPVNGAIALPEAEQQLLHCHPGDTVRTLTLNLRKNPHV